MVSKTDFGLLRGFFDLLTQNVPKTSALPPGGDGTMIRTSRAVVVVAVLKCR